MTHNLSTSPLYEITTMKSGAAVDVTALQNAAAKAERVLIEIKADIKTEFGRPSTPEGAGRLSGRYNQSESLHKFVVFLIGLLKIESG